MQRLLLCLVQFECPTGLVDSLDGVFQRLSWVVPAVEVIRLSIRHLLIVNRNYPTALIIQNSLFYVIKILKRCFVSSQGISIAINCACAGVVREDHGQLDSITEQK